MTEPVEYLADDVYERPILKLDPEGAIAIKRDVHDFEIEADAAAFARAFHEAMYDVGEEFGLIKVLRTRDEWGKPFRLGARFQGQYQIEDALRAAHQKGVLAWIERHVPKLVDALGLAALLRKTEDALTSDYGVITTFDLASPTQPTMTYEYLEGSPIAGSSTFLVTPLGPKRCRLTQIFMYQERHVDFVLFFSTSGLKLHDQVVYFQVKEAAARLGASFRSLDIPDAYVHP